MQVSIALYGAARVVTGKAQVDIALDEASGPVTLGRALAALCAANPRARPYLLTAADTLQSHIRVLINDARPQPDATLATPLRDGDRVTLLVAVAGGRPLIT
jgi:molybdopterin converting factor small subunit